MMIFLCFGRASPTSSSNTMKNDVVTYDTISNQCPSLPSKLSLDERSSRGEMDVVPIFIKMHKVGSTAVSTLIESLCDTKWWNATKPSEATQIPKDDFCW